MAQIRLSAVSSTHLLRQLPLLPSTTLCTLHLFPFYRFKFRFIVAGVFVFQASQFLESLCVPWLFCSTGHAFPLSSFSFRIYPVLSCFRFSLASLSLAALPLSCDLPVLYVWSSVSSVRITAFLHFRYLSVAFPSPIRKICMTLSGFVLLSSELVPS